MSRYKLNVSTLKSIKDVQAVLDVLGMTFDDSSPNWAEVSKYFNIPHTASVLPLSSQVTKSGAGVFEPEVAMGDSSVDVDHPKNRTHRNLDGGVSTMDASVPDDSKRPALGREAESEFSIKTEFTGTKLN